MHLPRPRLRLRTLLVAVAVVAVGLPLLVRPALDRARWGRLARYHRDLADRYEARATAERSRDLDAYAELFASFKWHQSMAAGYARSAAYGHPPPRPE